MSILDAVKRVLLRSRGRAFLKTHGGETGRVWHWLWLDVPLGAVLLFAAGRCVYSGAWVPLGFLVIWFFPIWVFVSTPHRRAWLASRREPNSHE